MLQAKLTYLKKQVNHIKATQTKLLSIEKAFHPLINHTSLLFNLNLKLYSHFKCINSFSTFIPQINKLYPINRPYYNYMQINHIHIFENYLTNITLYLNYILNKLNKLINHISICGNNVLLYNNLYSWL